MARQKAGKNPSRRSHPYPLREIARQAGLSEATVDRVLNGRGGVRASTAQTVHQAIDELDRQRTQVRLTGRTFLVDVVMQAPARFTAAVRTALEGRAAHPAARRLPGPVPPARDRSRRRGRGPPGRRAPPRLARRAAQGAGRAGGGGGGGSGWSRRASRWSRWSPTCPRAGGWPTSASTTGRRAPPPPTSSGSGSATAPGDVLVTLSRSAFRGEEEREMGFRRDAARRRRAALVVVPDTDGLDATHRVVRPRSTRTPTSVRSTRRAAATRRSSTRSRRARSAAVFVAHDLDADNVALLRAGRISAVLHHDLGPGHAARLPRHHAGAPGAARRHPARGRRASRW